MLTCETFAKASYTFASKLYSSSRVCVGRTWYGRVSVVYAKAFFNRLHATHATTPRRRRRRMKRRWERKRKKRRTFRCCILPSDMYPLWHTLYNRLYLDNTFTECAQLRGNKWREREWNRKWIWGLSVCNRILWSLWARHRWWWVQWRCDGCDASFHASVRALRSPTLP